MKDKIRDGIIGRDSMGREHILNLHAIGGAEVTAIADPHAGSREAAARRPRGGREAAARRPRRWSTAGGPDGSNTMQTCWRPPKRMGSAMRG